MPRLATRARSAAAATLALAPHVLALLAGAQGCAAVAPAPRLAWLAEAAARPVLVVGRIVEDGGDGVRAAGGNRSTAPAHAHARLCAAVDFAYERLPRAPTPRPTPAARALERRCVCGGGGSAAFELELPGGGALAGELRWGRWGANCRAEPRAGAAVTIEPLAPAEVAVARFVVIGEGIGSSVALMEVGASELDPPPPVGDPAPPSGTTHQAPAKPPPCAWPPPPLRLQQGLLTPTPHFQSETAAAWLGPVFSGPAMCFQGDEHARRSAEACLDAAVVRAACGGACAIAASLAVRVARATAAMALGEGTTAGDAVCDTRVDRAAGTLLLLCPALAGGALVACACVWLSRAVASRVACQPARCHASSSSLPAGGEEGVGDTSESTETTPSDDDDALQRDQSRYEYNYETETISGGGAARMDCTENGGEAVGPASGGTNWQRSGPRLERLEEVDE